MELFSFLNSPKDLDPSYKMDLDLPKQSQRSRSVLQDRSRSLGLFRKGKIGTKANVIGLILLFEVILEGQKPHLIAG